MTPPEIAQLILSTAALVTSVSGFVLALRKIENVHTLTRQVQIETNGMKAELVKEVREASFAKGVKSETDKIQPSENHAAK